MKSIVTYYENLYAKEMYKKLFFIFFLRKNLHDPRTLINSSRRLFF